MDLLWPVGATLIASAAALAGSAAVLWLGGRRPKVLDALLAFAVGTLLAAALLDLIPHGLEHAAPHQVGPRVLLGILGFLVLERLVRWRHTHADHLGHPEGHEPKAERGVAAAAPLVLWGDALHNLIDGFVIGAAFASDTAGGISTTLAVIAHEIPQEVGDFAILLAAGMPWRRALLLNWLVQLPPVIAAAATYLAGTRIEGAVGWLLPIAGGSLIYIALADLVPALHHRAPGRAAIGQLVLTGLGVAMIAALGVLH